MRPNLAVQLRSNETRKRSCMRDAGYPRYPHDYSGRRGDRGCDAKGIEDGPVSHKDRSAVKRPRTPAGQHRVIGADMRVGSFPLFNDRRRITPSSHIPLRLSLVGSDALLLHDQFWPERPIIRIGAGGVGIEFGAAPKLIANARNADPEKP